MSLAFLMPATIDKLWFGSNRHTMLYACKQTHSIKCGAANVFAAFPKLINSIVLLHRLNWLSSNMTLLANAPSGCSKPKAPAVLDSSIEARVYATYCFAILLCCFDSE